MSEIKHMYIKCSAKDFWKQYYKFKSVFDNESFYYEVPNSLCGEPHPQFTITILNHKITVFTTEHGIINRSVKK